MVDKKSNLGPGGSGIGFGFSDVEVDAVPYRLDVLRRYLAQLLTETDTYLAGASDADLAAPMERAPIGAYTPAARMQHTVAPVETVLRSIDPQFGRIERAAGARILHRACHGELRTYAPIHDGRGAKQRLQGT